MNGKRWKKIYTRRIARRRGYTKWFVSYGGAVRGYRG